MSTLYRGHYEHHDDVYLWTAAPRLFNMGYVRAVQKSVCRSTMRGVLYTDESGLIPRYGFDKNITYRFLYRNIQR